MVNRKTFCHFGCTDSSINFDAGTRKFYTRLGDLWIARSCTITTWSIVCKKLRELFPEKNENSVALLAINFPSKSRRDDNVSFCGNVLLQCLLPNVSENL